MLEGKDMFLNCCHLRIGFSSLTELKISRNGPRIRNYTADAQRGTSNSNSNSNANFSLNLNANLGATAAATTTTSGG